MSKAKNLLDFQNLNKTERYQANRENLRESQRTSKQWRWVGFDANTGQGIVRSGSEEQRGKVITNGAIVPGQLVDYNEVDGFGSIKSTPRSRPAPKPKPKKHVKKKKAGERIALYYKPTQRPQAEIGAIGASPVILGPSPLPVGDFPTTIRFITKTADGWIADEWLASVTRSFTGDSENVTDTLANGQVSAALDQTYAASAGYKTIFNVSSFGHVPIGYGHRSLYGYTLDLLVTFIPNSIFADGTPSDSDNNVTKAASWLQGFVTYGNPTVSLINTTATRQQVTPSVSTINGSGNGQIPFPDGMTKPLSWSQNARFFSGGTFPIGDPLNKTLNWQSARLIVASEDSNNYIFITYSTTETASTSGFTETSIRATNNRVIWRNNDAETEIASLSISQTSQDGTVISTTQTVTPSYDLFDDNIIRLNLVDDKLYRVNLATSDPIAGTYTVEVYDLPSMAMTTETIQANPIPDYNPDLVNYPPIASYHPG